MSNYSMKVNEALERYGAKTHGSLERRVERLKRFTDLKNKQYAAEIQQEVDIPVWRVITGNQYNLRSREQNGLNLLLQAIENGHVKTRRG